MGAPDDKDLTAVTLQVYYGVDGNFDSSYYVSNHVALALDLLGEHGLISVEGSRISPVANSPFPYQFVSRHLWRSEAHLTTALEDGRLAPLREDAPNFFDGHASPIRAVPIVRRAV